MAVLTAEAVAPKIREFSGNLAAVARSFGVTRAAVHKFVHERPTLLAVCQDCRESMKDNAESSLNRAVLNGEAWAVCFYLKTQAKDRGYVERQEVTGKDGAPAVLGIRVLDPSPAAESNGHAAHHPRP